MIQYLYALQNYPHDKSSHHLPNYYFLISRSSYNCRIISNLTIFLVIENTIKIRVLKRFLQKSTSNFYEMSFLYISPSKFVPFFSETNIVSFNVFTAT